MKKLWLLMPAILLVAAACNSKTTPPQSSQQTNSQQQTQTSPANQQTAPDQYTNWKTFNNNRVGYQFEYPASGLTLPLEETIKYPDPKNYNEDLVQFALDTKNSSEQQPVVFSVRTYVGVKENSTEEWMKTKTGAKNLDPKNFIKVSGQTAYTEPSLAGTYVWWNHTVYVIEGHAGIELSRPTDAVYQHLLSTFKLTNSVTQDNNYLTIKEWGVKFEEPQGMSDLLYVTKPFSYSTGNNTVGLITQRLVDVNKSIGGKCNEYYLGLLVRLTEKGLQDAQKNGPGIPDYVKVGNYYYYFSPPQEACFYNNSYDNEYAKLSGSQSSSLRATILKTLKIAP